MCGHVGPGAGGPGGVGEGWGQGLGFPRPSGTKSQMETSWGARLGVWAPGPAWDPPSSGAEVGQAKHIPSQQGSPPTSPLPADHPLVSPTPLPALLLTGWDPCALQEPENLPTPPAPTPGYQGQPWDWGGGRRAHLTLPCTPPEAPGEPFPLDFGLGGSDWGKG